MNDIIKPVATWISQNIPWTVLILLFVFGTLFEISRVPIYPVKWTWRLICLPFKKLNEHRKKYIKSLFDDLKKDIDTQLTNLNSSTHNNCETLKAQFGSMSARFDNLDARQIETEERLDKLAAARIKNHVLNFARQCRKGEPHSHEDFANLFKENQEYELLVEKYQKMDEKHKKEWENNVYKHDFEYIQRVYDECNNKGEFLE